MFAFRTRTRGIGVSGCPHPWLTVLKGIAFGELSTGKSTRSGVTLVDITSMAIIYPDQEFKKSHMYRNIRASIHPSIHPEQSLSWICNGFRQQHIKLPHTQNLNQLNSKGTTLTITLITYDTTLNCIKRQTSII